MRFVFYGTLDELKATLHLKAKEWNKDIVVYNNEPNILEIGFQRLGHSGGRFFIANIIAEEEKVTLEGEIKNIFPNQKKSTFGRICAECISYLIAYIILEFFLILIWLPLKDFVSLWIPLILPVIHLIVRYFLNKKDEDKWDKEFIEFLEFCTVYTSGEQYWDDVYKRLDLANGKLQSICDDDEDMLVIKYEDGMQIDVGYIEEDKNYYITVVKYDTVESWNSPLGEFAMKDKAVLPKELQKAIYKFRYE